MIASVDVTNIRIETERLILRPWKETDVRDFNEYASVDGVGQRCGWLPHKSLEESRMILNLFIQEKKTFALELKENGKVIGSVGLEARDADLGIDENLRGREIGYVLNKDYWTPNSPPTNNCKTKESPSSPPCIGVCTPKAIAVCAKESPSYKT